MASAGFEPARRVSKTRVFTTYTTRPLGVCLFCILDGLGRIMQVIELAQVQLQAYVTPMGTIRLFSQIRFVVRAGFRHRLPF
jgi:hypothetical protein